MFIAQLKIENYRCFRNATIEFEPGLNVIIGANNAGKSTLLDCLSLVFQREGRRRLVAHDFSRGIPPAITPPAITVTATIRSSTKDSIEDKAAIAGWITKLEHPWEAELSYRFFLPEEYHPEFESRAAQSPTHESFFDAIEQLLPKYVSRTYGGTLSNAIVADAEFLARFDFQAIDAIRDAVSEMFSGTNPLFRSMLQQVLDAKLNEEGRERQSRSFRRISGRLRRHIVGRLDLESLFQLVDATGASDGGKPAVRGDLREQDILAALRLFVAKTGFDLPVTHNGLGYNNLAYIALLLASLDFKRDARIRGPNAVLFPMLAIEEPEAHLHPSLQYRLLKYIRQRLESEAGSRQAFITTHSTQITAAAGLSPLICLWQEDSGEISASYPRQAFSRTKEGEESRAYVERYLDATKSNMLFARGVILVEGISEQLLLPVCGEYLALPFEEHHVAVVRVDGVTFCHFLPLFGVGDPSTPAVSGIRARVACITDADPSRAGKAGGVSDGERMKCWPFQVSESDPKFDYQACSATATKLHSRCANSKNVRVYSGTKTFEYDLAVANVSGFVVTDQCTYAAKLRQLAADENSLAPQLKAWLEKDAAEPLAAIESVAAGREKHAAMFATCYLLSVENNKGAHAFALEAVLRGRLADSAELPRFACPDYIRRAVRWVCKGEEDE